MDFQVQLKSISVAKERERQNHENSAHSANKLSIVQYHIEHCIDIYSKYSVTLSESLADCGSFSFLTAFKVVC